jgi:hypothetical protein
MTTPQIALIGVDGQVIAANTLPATGLALTKDALPVAFSIGVEPVQSFVSVPKFDPTSDATVASSIKLLVARNPNRRYLKIINNSNVDLELWTGVVPIKSMVGQGIPQGEILFAQGGLVEVGERISAIYATSSDDISGVMILEG